MSEVVRENLLRLMAVAGLSSRQVAEQTGLDVRTVRAILRGSKSPQPRTLHRLAEGLGVSVDEFFVAPAQLLYRRFDQQTNPLVDEVLQAQRELFSGWTQSDFDELHSRVGTGGPLTREGVLAAVRQMNRKRELFAKLDVLLESSHAKLAGEILDALHAEIIVKGD
jgi:transcriptional regulator with XRE-family HTH domain